jgi:hypothetical protein
LSRRFGSCGGRKSEKENHPGAVLVLQGEARIGRLVPAKTGGMAERIGESGEDEKKK